MSLEMERLKALGRLEEKKLKLEEVRLRMQGLLDSLRGYYDPHEPLEQIKAKVAAQQALEFAALQLQLKDLLEDIAALKRDLGI